MKITRIELLHSYPVEGGWRPLFVRIHTDEGIFGDGEAALSYGGISNAAFGMLQDMAPKLIGMDPLDNEVIWEKLYHKTFWGINGGPVVFAGISAFDIALWDIRGKAFGVPLYKLLGGKMRSSLRAYASQLQNGMGTDRKPCGSPEDYALVTRKAMDLGFDAVKFNFITFDENGKRTAQNDRSPYLPLEMMELAENRIRAVRDALGPHGDIILENHCYTNKESAVQFGNMAKAYGIMYFEEPVAPHPDLLKYVHDNTGLPIASGERIYSRWQFKEHLEKGSVQVIQPDIGNTGGITETKKICDMAHIYEAAVQIHVCGSNLVTAASLHLESTLTDFISHEYNVNTCMPKMLALTKYDYEPENGFMTVPELPGIGNEISDYAFRNSDIITVE